jgi:hypothetical protein
MARKRHLRFAAKIRSAKASSIAGCRILPCEAAFQRYGQYQRRPNLLTMPILGAGTAEVPIAEDHFQGSLEARLADLERLCGRLALENFLLKQALAEAGQSAP